jgi:hypothetical protein
MLEAGPAFGALYTDLAYSRLKRRCGAGVLPPTTIGRFGTRVPLEINRIADGAVGLKNGIADTKLRQLTLFCMGRPGHSSTQSFSALLL